MIGIGKAETTMSLLFRTLRSSFNKAIEQNLIRKEDYPFNSFKMAKFNTKTKKRAITKEEIKRILDLDLSDERPLIQLSKDLFIFSYLQAWQHKDNPILLPSKKSQSLTVFGLMNIDCKVYSHITTGSMNSTKLIACLDEFGASIVKKTIVVLDNASIHRSKLFKAKIEEWRELDLYIYFLPPYSPELNKIEILWRFIKYQWLPFDAFLSFQNLEKRLTEVINNIGSKHTINFY